MHCWVSGSGHINDSRIEAFGVFRRESSATGMHLMSGWLAMHRSSIMALLTRTPLRSFAASCCCSTAVRPSWYGDACTLTRRSTCRAGVQRLHYRNRADTNCVQV